VLVLVLVLSDAVLVLVIEELNLELSKAGRESVAIAGREN